MLSYITAMVNGTKIFFIIVPQNEIVTNLTKYVLDLYVEKYKLWWKNQKDPDKRYSMFM